jgi:hypothetical protein
MDRRTSHREPIGPVAAAAAVVMAFVLLAVAPAQAATDAEQAEALIREGVKLRANDNTAKALPLFEQAYQLSRTPRAAAQLGLCELELADYLAAERHLGEALAAPDAWVTKNKATLKKPLETARASIGELVLTLSPATADVMVNHKLVDRALLGAPIRLGKGSVDVEVRAPGYEPAHDTVTIVGGKQELRRYTLVAMPVASVVAPEPAPAPNPGPAVTLAAPSQAGEHRNTRLAAWITGGAAVGALVLGTVEAFSAASKRDAFNNHTSVVGGVSYHDCGTANLSPVCKTLNDDYDQSLALSIVGFVVTGALAATSSVLFVLSSGHGGPAERDGAGRAFACVPDPVGRGVGCSLRF